MPVHRSSPFDNYLFLYSVIPIQQMLPAYLNHWGLNSYLSQTAATTVLGRMKGASIFRVHDVKTNYREMKMIEAILEAK